ncbi:peptidoglycan-N-acetylmuramic acid deacetylase PdaC [Gottschalkia purinilytica]|uniref:Peptidoglycan-N-acetylmuramic acid deacetylase PdaC n=1 Tax=Gottschalkia purinilytica TaxID=1503 RepID=A0A0L0WBV2_GOTPU|nr:polysaccharide deacetylase family protein [Gottschalkia purinilytica]KNF08942.1 peptidoglycan-N-acetylmuramic acid deacetylase PdaC [Gottschalkia purinilytica]
MKKSLKLTFVLFIILFIASFMAWKIMNSRTFQFFGGIIQKANTQEKVVALTFDDGPSEKVDVILPILKDLDVKATFFLIGSEIERYPEEAKKLVLDGHQLGNHTYSHNRMVFKSPSYIKQEIEKTNSLIKEAGYEGVIQFRPPNGKKLIFLPYYLKQHNQKTILWDLEPNSYPDINSSSDKIAKYVIDNVKPGSIILLHPMYDEKGNTINSIKNIVEGLRSKGYTFKTVNELLTME